MASNIIDEDVDLTLGTTIPVTDPATVPHVKVVEIQGDREVTDGSETLEFIDVPRQVASRSANEQFVGIVTPGPNQEFTPFFDGFLKLGRKIKNENATDSDRYNLRSGVRLNNNRIINISPSKEYRETFEFETTERKFGEGHSGGPIRVVKDNMNDIAHALKSYYLDIGVVINIHLPSGGSSGSDNFKEAEIRCWLDQNKSGHVPELYMFQVQDGVVKLHMEILENVMTLRSLIFERRWNIISTRPSLLKPFSLYIFKLLLCVMKDFYNTGWAHNDLHSENVVLRIRSDGHPKLYVLDFENAKQSEDIEKDMFDIAGLFEGMLMGNENLTTTNKNARIIFSDDDIKELLDLINKCSFLVQQGDLPNYIHLVERSLERTGYNA